MVNDTLDKDYLEKFVLEHYIIKNEKERCIINKSVENTIKRDIGKVADGFLNGKLRYPHDENPSIGSQMYHYYINASDEIREAFMHTLDKMADDNKLLNDAQIYIMIQDDYPDAHIAQIRHKAGILESEKYHISATVNPLADQSGNVKAMASVTIDGVVKINNLTIVEGKNGLFVGYPQTKDKEGKFRNIIEFLKDKLKSAIQKLLIAMYKNGERATPKNDEPPVMHDVKAIVTPLRESKNSTRGLATVQVGDLLKINSIRINENATTNENFVAMPSRPDKSSESGYSNIVYPVNKDFASSLYSEVLKQYDKKLEWKNRTNDDKDQSSPQRDEPTANKPKPDLS